MTSVCGADNLQLSAAHHHMPPCFHLSYSTDPMAKVVRRSVQAAGCSLRHTDGLSLLAQDLSQVSNMNILIRKCDC